MDSSRASRPNQSSFVGGSGALRTLRDELSQPSPEPVRIAAPVEFLSIVSFAELPEKPISDIEPGATTVNVLNVENVRFSNASAVTVAAFTDGQEGQSITLKGDGNTTIANNAVIKTSTGANKLLSASKIYRFALFNNIWYEQDASAAAPSNIQHATFFTGEITHNSTGTSTWFPNNVNKYPIVMNALGMTAYRITIVAAGSGGTYTIVPTLYHSTDGSSWTADTALASASYTSGVPTIRTSVSTTLPVAARISPSYLAIRINPSGNVIVYSISIELS